MMMLMHDSEYEENRSRSDLPPITQLLVDLFDATAITLSRNWSASERAGMRRRDEESNVRRQRQWWLALLVAEIHLTRRGR